MTNVETLRALLERVERAQKRPSDEAWVALGGADLALLAALLRAKIAETDNG